MDYTPRIPTQDPLAGLVEVFFHLEGYSPEHRIERLVPNGRVSLVIELDGRPRQVLDPQTRQARQICRGAWLSGIHSSYLLIGDVGPDTRLMAVSFGVAGAYPFLHTALAEINDRVVDATDLLGPEILELRQALADQTTPANALDRLEQWLVARHDPERQAPPVVETAVAAILAGQAEGSLTRLVEESGDISYKHFLQLFKRHVGPSPKVLQRILRFAQIFERVVGQEEIDWADLSADLGYADQSHLIREFAAFSGYRPQRFAAEGHQRVNFFPDD
ncbi:MAG: helix-turn-helix domain-containing protein [Acidobacteriota bacterium]